MNAAQPASARRPAPDDPPPRTLDIRLVPAALLCWAVTLATVVLGWRVGVGVAVIFTLAVVLSIVLLPRRRARCGSLARTVAWTVLGAVTAGAGFATAAAWQEYRVATHPIHTAATGTYLTAVVVPDEDPKPLPARPFGGRQWLVRAELREYRYGEVPVRAGGSVLVLAPERGWARLIPGQTVRFRARVDRPWRRDLTVAVLRAQGPPLEAGPAPWWQRAAGAVRTRFDAAAARALPADAAGLLPGLVDGDVSGLPDEVREHFAEVELAHLTAVSGANVTIVLATALILVRTLTLDVRFGAVLAVLALATFVVLARPSPTVLRAAVMGGIAVLGMVTGRRKQALPALCAAVLGLLAWSPALAVDIGFALSVLATAGLILLAPGWSDRLIRRGWHRIPAEAFAVAAAAFLVTTPIAVALTGHLSLLAILANVLVEPVVAPITVLGALGAVLSCVWQPAADVVLGLTGPPLWWLLFVSEHGAALGLSLAVPDGPVGGVAAAVVVVVILAGLCRLGRDRPDRSTRGRRPDP